MSFIRGLIFYINTVINEVTGVYKILWKMDFKNVCKIEKLSENNLSLFLTLKKIFCWDLFLLLLRFNKNNLLIKFLLKSLKSLKRNKYINM